MIDCTRRRRIPLASATLMAMLACLPGIGLLGAGLAASGCAGAAQTAQNWVQKETTRQDPWVGLARDWIPPAPGGDPGLLVPTRAAGYTLGSHDTMGSVQNLGVSGSGIHGHYLGSNGSFDIYAFRAGPAEAATVFKEVIYSVNQQYASQANVPSRYRVIVGPISYRVVPSWLQTKGHKNVPVYSASRLAYSYGPPGYSGALWWQYGWLFLAQTSGTGDADGFLRGYLHDISNASAPGFSLPSFKMPAPGSGGFHFHL